MLFVPGKQYRNPRGYDLIGFAFILALFGLVVIAILTLPGPDPDGLSP